MDSSITNGSTTATHHGDISTPQPYKQALHALTYSVREAARVLGIGRESCYTLIRSGALRVLKIGEVGGKIRVPRMELEAFIERQLTANQGAVTR
jgi:excisionase family DNA binding protein